MWVLAFAYLLIVNGLMLLLLWADKRRATRGQRRIPEGRLLRLAAIGGTPGAFAGRQMFRHKTRKQPFSRRLNAIAAGQMALLLLAGAWLLSGTIRT